MQKLQNFYIRSLLFVALSVAAAIINYMLYPVLSRVLDLREFGDFVTVIGLSNQAMGVLLAFSIISITLVKQYGEEEANEKAQIIQKVLLWVFLGVSVLFLLISPVLLNLLKIEYTASFFILSIIMLLAVPSNIWSGYLQAHKEQIRVGLAGVVTAGLKFVGVVSLAVLYGVGGGLWGFLLGSLLGLFALYYLPGKGVPKLKALFRRFKDTDKTFLREYRGYVARTVFVVAGLVFLQNYDLNRAKMLFDPELAGMYGGVSVLSNALYYIAFLLIWVILPEFNIQQPHVNKRVLRTAYRAIAALAVTVVLGEVILGDWAMTLLLGEKFANQGGTLVLASLYQISLVSVTLYAFYLLVLRKKRSVILTGSVLLSCFVAPLPFTDNPTSMIGSLWLAVILGVGAYWLVCKLVLRGSRS